MTRCATAMLLLVAACGDPPAPSSATEPPASTPPSPIESAAPPPTPDTAPSSDAAPPAGAQIPDDMRGVPGGSFTMGADKVGEGDEQPAHAVTVKPFLLDETEVTNADYLRCVEAGACRRYKPGPGEGSSFPPEREFRTPTRPVSNVSHDDAEQYCAWAGKRLPTEAEWERAARGSDGRKYPWGDELAGPEHAVVQARLPAPVGSKPDGAGPYGHLDLAGNVWEWVADRYDPYAYRRATAGQGVPAECPEILRTQDVLREKGVEGFTGANPIPTECEFVLRGGAFNYSKPGLRASNRVHHPGHFRMVMAGFRCARDWPAGPVESDAGR